jgi:hypothetical protein
VFTNTSLGNCTDFQCWQNVNLTTLLQVSNYVTGIASKKIHGVTIGEGE